MMFLLSKSVRSLSLTLAVVGGFVYYTLRSVGRFLLLTSFLLLMAYTLSENKTSNSVGLKTGSCSTSVSLSSFGFLFGGVTLSTEGFCTALID